MQRVEKRRPIRCRLLPNICGSRTVRPSAKGNRTGGTIPSSYLSSIDVLREKTSFLLLRNVSYPCGIGEGWLRPELRRNRRPPSECFSFGAGGKRPECSRWYGTRPDPAGEPALSGVTQDARAEGRHGARSPAGEEDRASGAGRLPATGGGGRAESAAERGGKSYFRASRASRMRHTPHTSVDVG